MKRIILITAMVTAAGLSLVIGGASQALQTNVITNAGTNDGGTVVIQIISEGATVLQPGYGLLFAYSVLAPGASADINYAGTGDPFNGVDPNFDFGSPSDCNLPAQECQGANGGFLGKVGATRVITDSVNTFTLTGLIPGTVVNWHTDGSTGPQGRPSGQFTVIPEPAVAGLLGFGLIGLAFAGRRRR